MRVVVVAAVAAAITNLRRSLVSTITLVAMVMIMPMIISMHNLMVNDYGYADAANGDADNGVVVVVVDDDGDADAADDDADC